MAISFAVIQKFLEWTVQYRRYAAASFFLHAQFPGQNIFHISSRGWLLSETLNFYIFIRLTATFTEGLCDMGQNVWTVYVMSSCEG